MQKELPKLSNDEGDWTFIDKLSKKKTVYSLESRTWWVVQPENQGEFRF